MEDYVADARTYANNAQKSQTAAKTSETNAAKSVQAVQAAGQAQIEGIQAYLDNYISYDKVDGLAIKGRAEGTDIRVTDSAEYHVMDMEIYGKSEQGENPSIDIPQDIISVGDDGKIEIKTIGKNLVDIKNFVAVSSVTATYDPNFQSIHIQNAESKSFANASSVIPVKPNTVYNLSGHIKNLSEVKCNVGFLGSTDGGETFETGLITSNGASSLAEKDIRITLNTKNYTAVKLCLYCTYDEAAIGEAIFSNLQFEEGQSQTTYAPYRESSIVIPLSRPLYGLSVKSGGNATLDGKNYISDKIEKRNGKYGVLRNIAWCTSDDNDYKSKWFKNNDYAVHETIFICKPCEINNSISSTPLCNCLPRNVENSISNPVDFEDWYRLTNNIYVKLQGVETVSDFKQIASELNLTILFVRSDPIFEEFDDAAQALLRSLETFYPVTQLSISGDPLCRMVYARDPEMAYDALEKRIAALE